MAQKKRADADVAASDLDWVILRPGKLLDGPGGDTVSLGRAITYGDVDRETVARVLLALIEQPSVRREILELTDGWTPIQEAIGDLRQG